MLQSSFSLSGQPLQGNSVNPPIETTSDQSGQANSTALVPYTATKVITNNQGPAQGGAKILSTLRSSGLRLTVISFLKPNEMNALSQAHTLFRKTFQPIDGCLPSPLRMLVPHMGLDRMIAYATAQQFPLSMMGTNVSKLAMDVASIRQYLPAFRNLEALTLKFGLINSTEISQDEIDCIAANCSNLRTLDCSRQSSLNDDMLNTLAKKLAKLNGLSVAACYDVSDKGLIPLIESRAMRQLDLSDCRKISNKTILALAQNAAQLEMLNLNGCGIMCTFDGAALKTLFAQCKELREAHLSQSPVDDEACLELINNAPKLRKINLSMTHVSDQVIQLLVEKCLEIEEISISSCYSLTNASLQALSKCKFLRKVNLFHRAKITPEAIQEFRAANPKVELEVQRENRYMNVRSLALI